MIDSRDFMEQQKVYTRNGSGRWFIEGYCPEPSLYMRNVETGERKNFGISGLAMRDYDEIEGLNIEDIFIAIQALK
jgi:hypothetical protein